MTSVLMPFEPPRPTTPPEHAVGRGRSSDMRIDLSSLPALVQPAPPSNTLLITNLTNAAIFNPSSLATIRAHIETLVGGAEHVHAFSPLKSMRRIIVSFTSTDPAITLRRELDGVDLMGCRARLYFGEHTPVENTTQHLQAPPSEKQFFISPPPSPPHGWTMRNEEPPNKEVHAADLVSALARLDARRDADSMEVEELQQQHQQQAPHLPNAEDTEMVDADDSRYPPRRKSSTVVFHPDEHGGSPGLPAVLVVDMSEEGQPQLESDRRILEHTARPPVELMHSA